MKTFYKTIKIAAGVFLLAALAVSCLPEQQSMGDAGQTLVKLTPDGFKLIPLNAIATPQVSSAFFIRKDANSQTALNTPSTVVLLKDDAIITEYNTDEGTTFIPMSSSLVSSSLVPAADGKITLDFAAGEVAKEMIFTVPDATLFDFSKQYALAYRIESVSGAGIISQGFGDTIIVQILAKNKYDGKYLLKGVHNRVPYNYPYKQKMEMHTTGANSVRFFWPGPDGANAYGHPIGTGPDIVEDVSWYGTGIGPVVVFDPVTNLVTDVYNAGGSTLITKFTGEGSNSNLYDPVTKTIYVSWNYLNNPLRAFTDTLTYSGPR